MILFLLLGALISFSEICTSVPITDFYPFGTDFGDRDFPKNDDGSSPKVTISSLFPFFNNQHSSLFVDTNGAISFQRTLSQYTPEPFPLSDGRRIIAPFWADVDIREGGLVLYRESTDSSLLKRATNDVHLYYPSQRNFQAAWIFIATWVNVAFYGTNDIGRNKRNTFQAILITNGQHSFTIFNYHVIQWTTGTASRGGASTGLGGTPAQVGFDGGDGINFYALNQSRTNAIINLPSLSNVDVPGKFVFRIDGAKMENGGCNTHGTITVTPRYIPMFGGKIITVSGPCIEEHDQTSITFGGGGVGSCIRRSKFSVRCSTPIFYRTGDVHVQFTITKSNQQRTTYPGIMTLLNPLRSVPLIVRLEPMQWRENNIVEIDWNAQLLEFDVLHSVLDIFSIKTNSNGLPILIHQQTISTIRSFILKVNSSASVLRISSSTQEQLTDSIWSDIFYVHPEYDTTTVDLCLNWQRTDDLLPRIDDNIVQACPCTLSQAEMDLVRFQNDPNCHPIETPSTDQNRRINNCIFHQNAKHCFRLNTAGPGNTGRLCCYDDNGGIMDASSPGGGGTLHRYYFEGGPGNIPYLSHFTNDLIPYLQCCRYGTTQTCNQYLERRPRGNCKLYQPVSIGRISGDPHFTTLDGLSYTFNGVGEFVFLKDNNNTFMAEVRMEQVKDENGILKPASLITSFAAKSYNVSDTLEIQLNTVRVADVLVNGELVDFTMSSSLDFAGLSVKSYAENQTEDGSLRQFNIVFKQPPIAFRVLAYAKLLNIFIMSGSEGLKGQIDGLLGNNNGLPDDDLRRLDGSYIPENSTTEVIHREVGLKWRVNASDSLFTYPNGRNYDTYQNINFTPRFHGPTQVSAKAREVCGMDSFCLYDYSTTGDMHVAMTTKATGISFHAMKEKAEVLSCGFPRHVEYGYWNATGVTENSTAALECYEGYLPTEMQWITCASNGNWTESNITCEEVNCGQPTNVEGGYWEFADTVLNSTATLNCKIGFIKTNNNSILCNTFGLWENLDNSCQEVLCQQPEPVERGQWQFHSLVYNSSAHLICNPGYFSPNSQGVVCGSDGVWHGISHSCEVVRCGSPKQIKNGRWDFVDTIVNSTAVLNCDKGYIPEDSAVIACHESGIWDTNAHACVTSSQGSDQHEDKPSHVNTIITVVAVVVVSLAVTVSVVICVLRRRRDTETINV